jgi:hypothetical protein
MLFFATVARWLGANSGLRGVRGCHASRPRGRTSRSVCAPPCRARRSVLQPCVCASTPKLDSIRSNDINGLARRLRGNSGYSGVVLRFSGRPRRPDVVVELLGTPREAQKQPGILPAHTATLAQHSPPLNVLQQQSTSSPTLHLLSIVDASGPASGTRHRAMLSGYLSQRDPAFAVAANINVKAITMILPMGRSRDGTPPVLPDQGMMERRRACAP